MIKFKFAKMEPHFLSSLWLRKVQWAVYRKLGNEAGSHNYGKFSTNLLELTSLSLYMIC